MGGDWHLGPEDSSSNSILWVHVHESSANSVLPIDRSFQNHIGTNRRMPVVHEGIKKLDSGNSKEGSLQS